MRTKRTASYKGAWLTTPETVEYESYPLVCSFGDLHQYPRRRMRSILEIDGTIVEQ